MTILELDTGHNTINAFFSIIELICFSINAIVYSKISSRSAEKFTSIYSPMENNVFRALKNEVHPKIYNSL